MAAEKAEPKKKSKKVVKVQMIATSKGYYQNRVIREGQKFVYEGGLNAAGGLPMWAKPLDKDWKKSVKEVEVKAPAKKEEDLGVDSLV